MVAWKVILIMQIMTVRIRLFIAFQRYLDTCDDDHENQDDHSPENSPFSSNNDSEEQNIDGVVDNELTTCITDNESEYSGKGLDLNDPRVIKLFA